MYKRDDNAGNQLVTITNLRIAGKRSSAKSANGKSIIERYKYIRCKRYTHTLENGENFPDKYHRAFENIPELQTQDGRRSPARRG